ncbi:MAG: ureidoglycolate lyase [Parasphingorhabdus sp.]
MTETIHLPLERANTLNLKPFGDLVGNSDRSDLMPIDFYDGTVKVSKPAPFLCEHPVDLSLTMVDPRRPEVRYMERHFQHTQVFMPLGGKPFVVVMAPPSSNDMPDLSAARAFLFDGSAGFLMHVGTWHEFPFAVEPSTEIVVILSSQTGYDLQNSDPVTEEAFGPDLDKKDILARAGIKLSFQIN